MTVVANGKTRQVATGITVLQFLTQSELVPERIVVEHNGRPLQRDRFSGTVLRPGDTLEIAQMVGGG